MKAYEQSAMERLSLTSRNMELWWDSNPLVFENFCKDFLAASPKELQDLIAKQLNKLWDEKETPNEWVLSGVTTNPPLNSGSF